MSSQDIKLSDVTSTAIQAIPGVGEVAMAAQVGAKGAKTVLGEENYNIARSAGPWLYAAGVGFMPIINPIGMIFQIPMFIIFTIIFAWFFGWGWKSLPAAWITQALITMFTLHWMYDRALTYGVGI